MNRSIFPTLAIAAIAAIASVASAQSSAAGSVNVTGTVLGPISISNVSPLDFGSIGQGVPKTIAPDDPTSGRFLIHAQGASTIKVALTFPATFSNGAATLHVNNYTIVLATGPDAPGGSAVLASPGFMYQFQLTQPGTSGQPDQLSFCRLGGSISPTGGQAPGNYTAAIAVTVIYLGI